MVTVGIPHGEQRPPGSLLAKVLDALKAEGSWGEEGEGGGWQWAKLWPSLQFVF